MPQALASPRTLQRQSSQQGQVLSSTEPFLHWAAWTSSLMGNAAGDPAWIPLGQDQPPSCVRDRQTVEERKVHFVLFDQMGEKQLDASLSAPRKPFQFTEMEVRWPLGRLAMCSARESQNIRHFLGPVPNLEGSRVQKGSYQKAAPSSKWSLPHPDCPQ